VNDLFLEALLQKRKEADTFRQLKVTANMIDFTSNDYFGFNHNKKLKRCIAKQFQKSDENGSGGSRLLSGNNILIEKFERRLAQLYKTEATLLFNSGFAANIGILSTVPQKRDIILFDEECHASLKDGMRLSFAKKTSFKHNNIADLEEKILKIKSTSATLKVNSQNIFLVTEGLYSMSGDNVFTDKMLFLVKDNNLLWIIDEAHSNGIYGKKGRGFIHSKIKDIHSYVFARIFTFGKALGLHGAVIAGSQNLRDYLINNARTFIYTTALPSQSVIALNCHYNYLIKNYRKLQKELFDNITYFKQIAKKLNLNVTKNDSPIQACIIPGVYKNTQRVKQVASYLQSNKIDVRAIVSPTVKEGDERLRICIHSFNKKKEILQLLELLDKALKM